MCNMNIENLEIENPNIWDYCFECGTPLSEDMKEGEDWFDIRNCGESFPICKECHDKAERGELDNKEDETKMEIQTPFELPTFKGYTIDKRLRQFRKVSREKNPQIEFIDFDSDEGQVLLDELWEYFKFLWEV